MTLVREEEKRSQHTEDEHVRELWAIVEEQQQRLHIQNSLLAELEEETIRQEEVRYLMCVLITTLRSAISLPLLFDHVIMNRSHVT